MSSGPSSRISGLLTEALPPGRVAIVSLSELTTWRVGGPAVVVSARSSGELEEVLRVCAKTEASWVVLGKGSNVLAPDDGTDSVVIRLEGEFSTVVVSEDVIHAGAGASLPPLAGSACMRGLAGLEFAIGIPGTVGGAIYMNAGAYGSSMSEVAASIRFLETRTLEWQLIPAGECGFSYRTSLFQSRPDLIIAGTSLRLSSSEGSRDLLMAEASRILQERRERFPLSFPNCGSVFRRTEGAPPPGKLIEECGLKGLSRGDAMVSKLHANFIVNLGRASSEDISELMAVMKKVVADKTGILLEEEVECLA